MSPLPPLHYNQLAISCAFRLPNSLEFTECLFHDSCRSIQGSISADQTNFKQVTALCDILLNECHADQVHSEKMGITWFNQHPTFVNQILAIQNIVLDGISSFVCHSQSGSITARKGYISQIFAAGPIELDKISANKAFSHESVDLTHSMIYELDALDKVRLTASHVQILKLHISQREGIIELAERSTIHQVMIIPGFEPNSPPEFEITMSGNGKIGQPILSFSCKLKIHNHLH